MGFKLEVNIEELAKKRKLFIATPMYGGQCLHRENKVLTEDGEMTMKDIVDSQYRGKVASFNIDGKLEYKKVLAHKKENNVDKVWVRVKTENGKASATKLICTDDHECAVVRDILYPKIEYVRAKDMPGAFSIRSPYAGNTLYNKNQISALIGTLLGDGSIKKGGAVSCTHSVKQRLYAEYKAELFGAKLKYDRHSGGFSDNSEMYTFETPINAQTRALRKMMYIDGNKTVEKIVEKIDAISLAFWYMDDGYIVYDKHNLDLKPLVAICTDGFSDFDIDLLVNHLNYMNIAAEIMDYKGYKRIKILNHDAFFDAISPYVHKSMNYKLPPKYNDVTKHALNSENLDYSAEYVEEVVPVSGQRRYSMLYDIEVEGNNNFIANHTLVHNCAGMYTRSMMELTNLLTRMNIAHQPYFLFNESLITRARNYCCDEFMRSDCTHMLFIDSDIGFNPNDIIAILAMMEDDSDYDIMGGPYPKKCISWEKVKAAVDKGFADDDPNELEKFVGDFVFNPKAGGERIPIGEPVEVLEIGTGFMMIKRKCFEVMNKKFPELLYKPDHVRTEHFDGTREIMMYFQAAIDAPNKDRLIEKMRNAKSESDIHAIMNEYDEAKSKASKRYLSEDYWFCSDSQTRIETPDGMKTIKQIVDTKYAGPVLSVDKMGNRVWKNVTNWWSRPNGKRGQPDTKKKWVTFDTDCDNNTKAKLKVTDDHRVAVFDNVYDPEPYFTAAKNAAGKYIVRDVQRTENPLYNKIQLSCIAGTLLGDSSIGKQGQMSCQHSDTQREYIEFKANLFNGKINGPVKQNGFGDGKFKYVMHCPINAQTRAMKDHLYNEDGTKNIQNIMSVVDEKSLAFWYMDDGSLHPSGAAYIATNGFSLEDNEHIKDVLKEKFGLDVVIDNKKVKYQGETREYPTLRMNKESSKNFFDLICEYIPRFMEYKLPTTHRNRNVKFDYSSVRCLDFAASFVTKVRELVNHSSRLYDIEVEDTHNFFASGTLAHNCQRVQEAGLQTWLCPWMKTYHVGTYIFGGSLPDLAAVGVAATADAGIIQKNREKKKRREKK